MYLLCEMRELVVNLIVKKGFRKPESQDCRYEKRLSKKLKAKIVVMKVLMVRGARQFCIAIMLAIENFELLYLSFSYLMR